MEQVVWIAYEGNNPIALRMSSTALAAEAAARFYQQQGLLFSALGRITFGGNVVQPDQTLGGLASSFNNPIFVSAPPPPSLPLPPPPLGGMYVDMHMYYLIHNFYLQINM